MATALLTSTSGIIALLDEPEDDLKIHALKQLSTLVDTFWSEIAADVSKIEELYENEDFKSRDLAAVVASKVYYHLEALDDALKYALGAGALFDVENASEYVDTLIAKCIDDYISIRVKAFEEKSEAEVDPRLEAVVERMFERCFNHGTFKQAVGIAMESRRLDMIKKSILASNNMPELLSYCFNLSHRVISNKSFRDQVLKVLAELYQGLEVPDYINMSQCLLFLDDHETVATMLDNLIQKDDCLLGYQVAFDLYDNQNQPFLIRVTNALPKPEGSEDDDQKSDDKEEKTDQKEEESVKDDYPSRMKKLKKILSGEIPVNLYLHFLYGHNKTDLTILNQIKEKLEPRNSVTHNATVMAHAIMHVGTTVDTFLRDNLEWLGRATNWAKFTATASIGVIHKGHVEESLKILAPYLPQAGQSGSPYQEGGALYALGLIHSNHASGKDEFLLEALAGSGTNEIIQHGACLGLGLTCMATQRMDIYEKIKAIVFTESAVAGEAAGLSMGLVLLGSGNGEALDNMMKYAHETQHEKIIRGLGMGMALIVYGREEEADVLIEQLIRDKDPILRYGGCYAVAMAYVATGNNSAIRRLLHVAVSDVSDDVRRAAVTALGFVLCNNPEQVPRLVSLLAESYNPHVRYGSCLAVGVACAGLGNPEAIALLEPLTRDRVDFVRQGAFIALSMVLIQHNEIMEPKVKKFRESLFEAVSQKGDTMTKLGAILGAGILDAGGRNMTISLVSPSGHKKMAAIVGTAIFPQFWYWYPHVHFISLAFTPTAVIGLNNDLKMPRPFEFKSNVAPSKFAYPANMVIKKAEVAVKAKAATLSVTAKSKRGKAKEEEKKEGDKEPDQKTDPDKMDETDDKVETEEKEKAKVKVPEASFEILSNPARVTWKQQAFLSFDSAQRYQPVKAKLSPGVVMLRDTSPGENEDIVVSAQPKIGIPGISDDEPEPPEPFEFLR